MDNAFDTHLTYTAISVEKFKEERITELGEFIGTVITGIYQGIREGELNNPSDYARATGRAHQSWEDYFEGVIPKSKS